MSQIAPWQAEVAEDFKRSVRRHAPADYRGAAQPPLTAWDVEYLAWWLHPDERGSTAWLLRQEQRQFIVSLLQTWLAQQEHADESSRADTRADATPAPL